MTPEEIGNLDTGIQFPDGTATLRRLLVDWITVRNGPCLDAGLLADAVLRCMAKSQ